MGGTNSVIEILIFAAVAVFLIFRLRAVLGRRTGEEPEQTNPFERSVAPFHPPIGEQRAAGVRPAPVIDHDPGLPLSLDARIARIEAADPAFDEKTFLAGARSAFKMIVQAFGAGDLATLRPLLSSQLYGEFGRSISERRDRGELGPVAFEGPIGAEIADAEVAPREVRVTVSFTSRQLHAGETVPPEAETVDLWTFTRDPTSRDPNWQLSLTQVPD
jgi:predicted lipid-binding transport protein (Tim44 family)